jgi:CheY-like chemotaxis protein
MKVTDAKILVVDDDKLMLSYVLNLLLRLGVREVKEANDGTTGLRMLASCRPDVVLSDIHMAPMDGLEFVRQIRAHATLELRKTPVLIMSADSNTEKLNATAPLGVAGYIIKPPSLAALRTKLEHALKFRAPSRVDA